MSLVSIRDVRKSFGANEVLKGVSLDIAAATWSPSSAGPAPARARCCAASTGWRPTSPARSSSTASRSAARQTNLRELRRHVGMVFQQFNLFPHLTAAENVMLAPTVVNKVSKAEARATRRRNAGQGRAVRQDGRLSEPALRRPAAARRDRARAGDAAERAAVRRDHLGARPRARQRGAARGRATWRARA